MEENRHSVVYHLRELRARIIYCLLFWILAAVLIYYFTPAILKFLAKPLNGSLVFTSPSEAFMAYIKLALLGGFFLALPFMVFQLFSFAAPGLRENERKWLAILLFPAFLLFLGGAAFSLLLLFPLAIKFFISFGSNAALTPLISVKEYLGLATALAVMGGISFQLPLIMLFLAVIGIFSSRKYLANWKYAVLLSVIAAGLFTPTVDAFTQILFTLPLILLYGVGVWLCRIFKK